MVRKSDGSLINRNNGDYTTKFNMTFIKEY